MDKIERPDRRSRPVGFADPDRVYHLLGLNGSKTSSTAGCGLTPEPKNVLNQTEEYTNYIHQAKNLPQELWARFESGMNTYLSSQLEKLTIESKGPAEVLRNLGKFTTQELETLVLKPSTPIDPGRSTERLETEEEVDEVGTDLKEEYNTPLSKLLLGYYSKKFEQSIHSTHMSQFIVGLLLGMDKQMLKNRMDIECTKDIVKELVTSDQSLTKKEIMLKILPEISEKTNTALVLYAIDMFPTETSKMEDFQNLSLNINPNIIELYQILKMC